MAPTIAAGELGEWVGREVGLSEWVTVDQARIDAFADATGDHNFVHTDPARAADTPFGGTIAHGFLTLSLIAGDFLTRGGAPQITGLRMLLNYGLDRVRFVTPVRVGARLRNRAVLLAAEQGAGYWQLTMENTVEIEGESRPACVAVSLFRVYVE